MTHRKRKIWMTVVVFLCVADVARAQEAEQTEAVERAMAAQAESQQIIRKVIRVEHVDPVRIADTFMSWANIHASRELKLVAVKGDRASVEAVEEAIRRVDVPPQDTDRVTKMIPLGDDLDRSDFLGLVNSLTGATQGPSLHPAFASSAVLATGSPEQIEQVEKLVLDLRRNRQNAQQNVQITAYFLGVDAPEGSVPVPQALRPVVAQLESAFPYSGYHLLETLVTLARVGSEASVSGVVPEETKHPRYPVRYRLVMRVSGVAHSGDQTTIGLEFVQAGLRVPVNLDGGSPIAFEDLGVSNSIDIPEGKTVIVGKAGAYGSIRALFVALQAKVVD